MKSLLLIVSRLSDDMVFIQHELKYLADAFDKVYLLSFGVPDDKSSFVTMPENVVIIYCNIKNQKIKMICLMPLLVFIPHFYYEVYSLYKHRKLSIHSLIEAVKFLSDSLLQKIYINKILVQYHDITMIYTYWYYSSTMAVLLINERLKRKRIIKKHTDLIYTNSGISITISHLNNGWIKE